MGSEYVCILPRVAVSGKRPPDRIVRSNVLESVHHDHGKRSSRPSRHRRSLLHGVLRFVRPAETFRLPTGPSRAVHGSYFRRTARDVVDQFRDGVFRDVSRPAVSMDTVADPRIRQREPERFRDDQIRSDASQDRLHERRRIGPGILTAVQTSRKPGRRRCSVDAAIGRYREVFHRWSSSFRHVPLGDDPSLLSVSASDAS